MIHTEHIVEFELQQWLHELVALWTLYVHYLLFFNFKWGIPLVFYIINTGVLISP